MTKTNATKRLHQRGYQPKGSEKSPTSPPPNTPDLRSSAIRNNGCSRLGSRPVDSPKSKAAPEKSLKS